MADWNPTDPDAVNVHYDLSAWTFDQQAELAAAMADHEVPHAWDGSELVVPESREDEADELIDEVERRLGIEDASVALGGPAPEAQDLADGVDATEYDLGEWPAADTAALEHALADAGIPFRWEERVLLVATDDEPVVDALLDEIEHGDYADVQGEGDTSEVLTELFLAAERLRSDPLDAAGLEHLRRVGDLDPERPPFGVTPRLWQQACTRADALLDALVGDDEPDGDATMEAAARLHDLLRDTV